MILELLHLLITFVILGLLIFYIVRLYNVDKKYNKHIKAIEVQVNALTSPPSPSQQRSG